MFVERKTFLYNIYSTVEFLKINQKQSDCASCAEKSKTNKIDTVHLLSTITTLQDISIKQDSDQTRQKNFCQRLFFFLSFFLF